MLCPPPVSVATQLLLGWHREQVASAMLPLLFGLDTDMIRDVRLFIAGPSELGLLTLPTLQQLLAAPRR